MTFNQLADLLELPNVDVFVIVGRFTGKHLGTVSDQGCTFSDRCPFTEDDCKKAFSVNSTEVRIAVLTPKHPDSEITKKNLTRSYCQIFDDELVTILH